MDKYNEIKDEELVDLVKSDSSLYSYIIKRYQNKLLRYTSSLLKDEDKAVDAVQETFIKSFINLNSFNTSKKFSSWIYRIAHNEAVNLVRKYKLEVPLSSDFDLESDEDIEEEISREQIKTRVENCLRQIPLKYSEPISLYYIGEKSYEEISDILRLPIGTVSVRINRAKKILKNICEKN